MNRTIIVLILVLVNGIYAYAGTTDSLVLPDVSKLELYNDFKVYKNSEISFTPVKVEPSLDVNHQDINWLYFSGISAATLGSAAAVHFYQANAWWKDERTKFKIVNDWEYALWIDKIGHFYGTYLIQHGFSASFEGSGFNLENSAWLGAGCALGFQLFVEIEDGFGPQWGFSPGDALFDVFGAAYPIFQYYYPYLNNFKLKFSYYPVDLNKVSPTSGQKHILIDDYSGQKFWLSFRMKNLLPDGLSANWPAWLNLAVGYGVKNLNGSGGGQKDVYIAFDLDIEEIPLFGKPWGFIKNTLNYAHFPMPGVRITNGVAFFGLCY